MTIECKWWLLYGTPMLWSLRLFIYSTQCILTLPTVSSLLVTSASLNHRRFCATTVHTEADQTNQVNKLSPSTDNETFMHCCSVMYEVQQKSLYYRKLFNLFVVTQK